MSLATLAPLRPTTPATVPAPAEAPESARRLRAVPAGTEPRGFALYVGIDETTAEAAGTDLGTIVQTLKRALAEIAPSAETYAAVALAPAGAGGRDVDVVRLALQDPAALAKHRQQSPAATADEPRGGVVIDISRKRVQLDGDTAPSLLSSFCAFILRLVRAT